MHYYSDAKNTQILIALLKAHCVHDIVISPGGTNVSFVLSVQEDPDFCLYSAVDERHAGYLACGIAQETGRPVAINCTGATASRNFMPALTEAYYRKLPIIAVTCSQHSSHLGNMHPQMTDRMHLPTDIAKLSVQCPIPHTLEEIHSCELKINAALLETCRHGGGPVHINLEIDYVSISYTCAELPGVTKISRFDLSDQNRWPTLPHGAKIAVWIGAHKIFSIEEKLALETFAQRHDAVVLTDLTSNYNGANAVRASLICSQQGSWSDPEIVALNPDLIIHIGEITGDYPAMGWLNAKAPVWRVSEDGEIRDKLGKLVAVFESPESAFFAHYSASTEGTCPNYAEAWIELDRKIRCKLPEIPFSNTWVARTLAEKIPPETILHLGILNPLRCWNMTDVKVARAHCLTGGFGIDGGTSSMLGSSLATPDHLHLGIFGDLCFFYDLNALGSRHLGKNARIVVINNNGGGEFSTPNANYDNPVCAERVHPFVAASGHFGGVNSMAIEHIAKAFNLRYFSAKTKEEFTAQIPSFLSAEEGAAVFECKIDVMDDRAALEKYYSIIPRYDAPRPAPSLTSMVKAKIPARVKNVIKAAIA